MATGESFILSGILGGICISGDVENEKWRIRSNYSVRVYVDEKEVAKSTKRQPRLSELEWKWDADTKIFFNPSSTMKVVLFREFRIDLSKGFVAQYKGRAVDFLQSSASFDLTNKKGVNSGKMKMSLSPIPQSDDNISELLSKIDNDVTRLEPGASLSTISMLGGVLTLTKAIMDKISQSHPLLNVSWTIVSSVYQAVQDVDLQDDSIRGLAKSLNELLVTASKNVALIGTPTTINVVEEIGLQSIQVASLIDAYTRLPRIGRLMQIQLSPALKGEIMDCQNYCNKLKSDFAYEVHLQNGRQLKTIVDNQLEEKIAQWLAAPDSSANLHEAQRRQLASSCAWVLNDERFNEWQRKPGFLWIKGLAGSGKSILASAVINELNEAPFVVNDPSRKALPVAISYFFFDARDGQDKLQNHSGLIQSLISQFTDALDGTPTVLAELYKMCGRSRQPSITQLEDTLKEILTGFSHAYIVVDAVDECTDHHETLTWIKNLFSKDQEVKNFHILVTSRPEVDITRAFEMLDPRSIDFGTMMNGQDIVDYIEDQMKSESFRELEQPVQNQIQDALKGGAHGSFRWVALQIADLKTCRSLNDIEERLNQLPEGLDEIYRRVLKKIDNRYHADTLTFLQWLAFSRRPMTLREITETATVEVGLNNDLAFNAKRRYFNPKGVLERCSSLVSESDGVVKFSHFSVKEYLLSDRVESYFKIDATTSHTKISRISIAYLGQFDSWDPLTEAILDASPLAEYAAKYCIDHAKLAGMSPSVFSAILTLLAPGTAALTNWVRIHNIGWMRYYHRIQDLSLDQKNTPSPLYLASSAGLQEVSKHLTENLKVDVNTGWGDCTPLYAASSRGHQEIVKLLLEHKAEVNVGTVYGTPLHAASSRGHQEIVELLLEHKADVNAGGEEGTPLYAAAQRGHLEIVNLLLEHKADVDAAGEDGTPLFAASWNGHLEIVNLLLEHKADMNAGGKSGTPLYAASRGGHLEIVKLLLEHNADVNAGGEDGTPLYAASEEGHEEIVKLLLEHNPDVNAGAEDGTPLYTASWWGCLEIVKLLLEHKADVNAGGEDGTPLYAASEEGHEEIVKLLLEHNADVNAGGEDGTPLYAASRGGHLEIVKLLLEDKADMNAGGKDGTPLYAASEEGHEEIVKLLLEHNADMNAGAEDGTPLYTASWWGCLEIVKLLLEHKADVNAGGEDGTPLYAASEEGHKEIVKLLLEHNPDVNAGREDDTPLDVAQREGHDEIVKILLDNGAVVRKPAKSQ